MFEAVDIAYDVTWVLVALNHCAPALSCHACFQGPQFGGVLSILVRGMCLNAIARLPVQQKKMLEKRECVGGIIRTCSGKSGITLLPALSPRDCHRRPPAVERLKMGEVKVVVKHVQKDYQMHRRFVGFVRRL